MVVSLAVKGLSVNILVVVLLFTVFVFPPCLAYT